MLQCGQDLVLLVVEEVGNCHETAGVDVAAAVEQVVKVR